MNKNEIKVETRKVTNGTIIEVSRTIQDVEQRIDFDSRLFGRISKRDAVASARSIWNRNPFYGTK